MPKIRFAPVYVNNKKVAELEDVTYDLESGDESMIGTDGYLAHSDGAITCTLLATAVVPVSGTTPGMVDLLLNKADVGVGLPIDGKMFKFTGRLTKINYKSASKSGATTGGYSFGGGKPDAI